MNPGIFTLFFVTSRLISLSPCTGSHQTIIEKKRVLFQTDDFLAEDLSAAPKFATIGSTLRIRVAGQPDVSVNLPSKPHRTFRKNNLVILALGDKGIQFIDVRDPARPRTVLHRVLDKPVDGFVVYGSEILPTSGGQPIEEILTRVEACPASAPPPAPAAPPACVEYQEADPGPPLPAPRLPSPPPAVLQPAPAGTTELALFTTARTLSRGAGLVELSGFMVPQEMPGAAVELIGVKSGLTQRLQVGLRTSPSLLSELDGDAGGLLVAGLIGLSFKYQLYKSESTSVSFNYVFPYTELIYSAFDGADSFTLAGGTSLVSLLMWNSEQEYRDFFVRTGVQKRLNPGMAVIVEAGLFKMLGEHDPAGFVNAALRIGGDSIYLDLMAGATNLWAFGGVTLGVAY